MRPLVWPALLALLVASAPAVPEPPSLLVPARSDSASDRTREAPPAPLLEPGRLPQADTTAQGNAAERAREALEKVRLGQALERQGNPAAAMAAYHSALLLDPTVPDAYYRMGRLFLTVNQVPAAANSFAAELKHHPSHLEAARQLGIALTRLGEYPAAIMRLERLTRRDPRDDESWHALGAAYIKVGRDRDAEAALRHAVGLAPRNAEYHRDLGVTLAAQGRNDAARAEYTRASRLDPRDATAWLDLGNLERREHRLERALEAYRQAEARDSTLALAFQGQVETLRDQGHELEGAAVYRRWLRAHPDDHQARLEAVRLLAGAGRRDMALELARDGVRAEPSSGDARLTLGMALHWAGDPHGGLAEMRRAEALFPDTTGRTRAREVIASVRAQAPDSLRALYAADSVAHAGAGATRRR